MISYLSLMKLMMNESGSLQSQFLQSQLGEGASSSFSAFEGRLESFQTTLKSRGSREKSNSPLEAR